MSIYLGTSSGNKEPSKIWLGTSSGNKEVSKIYLGTSNGNKEVYTSKLPDITIKPKASEISTNKGYYINSKYYYDYGYRFIKIEGTLCSTDISTDDTTTPTLVIYAHDYMYLNISGAVTKVYLGVANSEEYVDDYTYKKSHIFYFNYTYDLNNHVDYYDNKRMYKYCIFGVKETTYAFSDAISVNKKVYQNNIPVKVTTTYNSDLTIKVVQSL